MKSPIKLSAKSFIIWENRGGAFHLHGRYPGNSVEEALDSLAREQHSANTKEWLQRKQTTLGQFKFEEVTVSNP